MTSMVKQEHTHGKVAFHLKVVSKMFINGGLKGDIVDKIYKIQCVLHFDDVRLFFFIGQDLVKYSVFSPVNKV